LHTLPEPLPPTPAPTLPTFKQLPNFAQLLAQQLRKDP
ncbi:flagellar protein, partial [Xanthomonas perforans]